MKRRMFKQIVTLFLTIAMLLPLAGTAEDSIVIDDAAISNDEIIIEPMEADAALPIETEISLGGSHRQLRCRKVSSRTRRAFRMI